MNHCGVIVAQVVYQQSVCSSLKLLFKCPNDHKAETINTQSIWTTSTVVSEAGTKRRELEIFLSLFFSLNLYVKQFFGDGVLLN